MLGLDIDPELIDRARAKIPSSSSSSSSSGGGDGDDDVIEFHTADLAVPER